MFRMTVFGHPATAGSKAAFVYKDKKSGKHRAAMAPASKKTKPWMELVAATAKAQYSGNLLTGPLNYTMYFHFKRPKSHYGTGRNACMLKASAPDHHIQKPDAMKLARAVEDALTGIVWKDDSQVCSCRVDKFWTDHSSRVEITIWRPEPLT